MGSYFLKELVTVSRYSLLSQNSKLPLLFTDSQKYFVIVIVT